MATKEKEVVKEEDPMYKKICNNSNDCSCERTTRVLSDMEVSSCSQCFHVLSWQKISIDKKSAAPKSKAVSVEEPVVEKPKSVTVKVEKPELQEIADESPNISIVSLPKEESDTDRDAAKLREVFAGVDDIMANVESNRVKTSGAETQTVQAPVVDFDPFEEAPAPEPIPETGFFMIEKIMRKEKEVIRLILLNETNTAKFILDKETQAEKADKIQARPDSMLGKYVKAEYFTLDDKGNPVDPVYVSLVLRPE